MNNKTALKNGYTLVELLVVIAILGIMISAGMLVLNPSAFRAKATRSRMDAELNQVATAIDHYVAKYGEYPADVWRDLPAGLEEFLPGGTDWPKGPYEGSVYDYDNWASQTCWNGATGIIQITLREVPGFNDDDDYNFYYVLQGAPGVPHCSNASEEGECINCGDL